MNEDWDEALKLSIQKMLPLLTSIIWVALSYMPFDFLLPTNIHANVAVICVYYWVLHRPDVFNLFSVFFLGLFEDVLTSAPLGSSIFQLLLLYVLVGYMVKYFNGKSFELLWLGFLPLAFVVMFARWFVVSIYYADFLPFALLMFSFLLTSAVYPLVTLVNVGIQNKLMTDEA